MMVVCIELRIPLFLVGKPGSSKSLAKSIVVDAMQGESSKIPLFKHLKQVEYPPTITYNYFLFIIIILYLLFILLYMFWLWSVVYIMLQSSPRAKATSCEK